MLALALVLFVLESALMVVVVGHVVVVVVVVPNVVNEK